MVGSYPFPGHIRPSCDGVYPPPPANSEFSFAAFLCNKTKAKTEFRRTKSFRFMGDMPGKRLHFGNPSCLLHLPFSPPQKKSFAPPRFNLRQSQCGESGVLTPSPPFFACLFPRSKVKWKADRPPLGGRERKEGGAGGAKVRLAS